MCNILIADPHVICREALCHYIRNADPELVVEGCSVLESSLPLGDVDLLVIDRDLLVHAPRNFGLTPVAVIVRASHEIPPMMPELQGAFPRTLSAKSFLGGIHEILSGERFFPSDEGEEFFLSETRRVPMSFNLTGREKEVLSYLVIGQSNKDIARALNLQVVTVKLHVRGICRKMKVSNRTQAALLAKENGWG